MTCAPTVRRHRSEVDGDVSEMETRVDRRDPVRRLHRGFFDCVRLAERLRRQDAGEPVLELHKDHRGRQETDGAA